MEETLQLKRLVCCTITLFALAGKAVSLLHIYLQQAVRRSVVDLFI